MSNDADQAYGLWPLVILNVGVFILFTFSFTRPGTARDWRDFGAFSAFLIALFTEMYGFPLTIYLLSGWFSSTFPGLNPLSHNTGHLWETLMGWKGDPHLNPLHVLSYVVLIAGFWLLAAAWGCCMLRSEIIHSRPPDRMPTCAIHNMWVLSSIMVGFLLQWPTLLTLIMFPILVTMYVRLAHREERKVQAEFGDA